MSETSSLTYIFIIHSYLGFHRYNGRYIRRKGNNCWWIYNTLREKTLPWTKGEGF